ncbi:MAG: PilZ domain-containing protein [Planctomycetota bacterium]
MGNDARMQAMRWCEKRQYKRVAVELELSCRKVGSPDEKAHSGRTVNVSPGGVYFHTGGQVFSAGDMLRVELSVPPNVGQLEFGGRVCALGRILRKEPAGGGGNASRGEWGLALEFCQSPRVSE